MLFAIKKKIIKNVKGLAHFKNYHYLCIVKLNVKLNNIKENENFKAH